ncbi:twin-arginine translocase TatA/TatE family subunit [Marichromatium bheemlicum]|uniref:Sec-independent protein translocase protein TatA n=1 Tax=Marichromatium bheemlicum TaxID=365339 RepID=A0ABX1ID38_9GAMM|nr:twin-arginine translocase TatA/TatE family subunit [Marichromatium bheemlicum]NKN34095.1 twin-arginine translocase TatA/TatE family subunit [Marichromatium bheemlicum]
MGAGGISIWQLLIILVIVLLLFGTKRLKNLGSDLGTAIKGFRSAMSDADKDREAETAAPEQLSEAERTDAKAASGASAETHKRQS